MWNLSRSLGTTELMISVLWNRPNIFNLLATDRRCNYRSQFSGASLISWLVFISLPRLFNSVNHIKLITSVIFKIFISQSMGYMIPMSYNFYCPSDLPLNFKNNLFRFKLFKNTYTHPSKSVFFFYQLHVLKKETLDINYYLEKENSVWNLNVLGYV